MLNNQVTRAAAGISVIIIAVCALIGAGLSRRTADSQPSLQATMPARTLPSAQTPPAGATTYQSALPGTPSLPAASASIPAPVAYSPGIRIQQVTERREVPRPAAPAPYADRPISGSPPSGARAAPPSPDAVTYLQAVDRIEGARYAAFEKYTEAVRVAAAGDSAWSQSEEGKRAISDWAMSRSMNIQGADPNALQRHNQQGNPARDQARSEMLRQYSECVSALSQLNPPPVCADFHRHYLEAVAITLRSGGALDSSARSAEDAEWQAASASLYHIWQALRIQPFFSLPYSQ